MKNAKRRTEEVDPNPMTLPVKFQKPPTLAEQIARFMGAHERQQALQGEETPDEADDFGSDELDEAEEMYSPHDLVYDELLNRELPRYEKVLLDRDRSRFDAALHRKMRDDKAAAEAASAAEAALRKKMSQKNESADADESEND